MVPSASCAYQSKVSSRTSPSRLTVSRTTRAVTPFAMRFVTLLTVTRTLSTAPSSSTSRYVHRVPTRMGQKRLSMSVVNVDGSSVTGSLPCGSGVDEAGVAASWSPPQPAASRHAATRAAVVETSWDCIRASSSADGADARRPG